MGRGDGEARHGDSIAVNGVCLTVTDARTSVHRRRDGGNPAPHRARRARPGSRRPGTSGPARRPAGATVQGTPTGTASSCPGSASDPGFGRRPPRASTATWSASRCPPGCAVCLVLKGSVTVDGVSLTASGLGGTDGPGAVVRGQPDPDDAGADHAAGCNWAAR